MIIRNSRVRCFGIDWLEYFVSEEPHFDYSPDGFRRRGWFVEERGYGTKTMEQMFKLLDNYGHPFIEIRRKPRGVEDSDKTTVYHLGDSYVRFDNMYCYDANPIELMDKFLKMNHYRFKKIYRIDLFIDLYKFDEGDLPRVVARRIVKHVYSKVNQTRRRTSGDDTWEDCYDNWISWGAKGSMVGTKFYDKTLEIRDSGFKKPYIVEMWRQAGFIDNPVTLSLNNHEVNIWRLEFSLKGNAKGWVIVDKTESESGVRYQLPHGPMVYSQPQGVLNAIANLIPHYFRFRIFEKDKRKDQCKEKVLFHFEDDNIELGYRLTSESDIMRVRDVSISSDTSAATLVYRAMTKLVGTEEYDSLFKVYSALIARTKVRSESIYSDKTALIF